MNLIFFGTSDISKVFLENILFKHNVSAVITKCDRPACRGAKLKFPAVKIYAIEKKIPFIQVDKFTDEVIERIKNYKADAGVVVSFGKLIPEEVFTLPKYGCFNIHFSLLPCYRGASPVQQALIDGQLKTGVTSFYIDKGLDSGSILLQDNVDICDCDNAETLFEKLVKCGISLMNKTLDLLEKGQCSAKEQVGFPSFCTTFKKDDGKIDWNKSARDIRNLFRGLFLWPGIFCIINDGKMSGKILKIIDCRINDIPEDALISIKGTESSLKNVMPGTIVSIKRGLGFIVKCGDGCLLITKVQPESKAQMSACDFLNGSGLSEGSLLG